MKIKTTEKRLTFTVLVISIMTVILFFISEATGTALLMTLAEKTGSQSFEILAGLWLLFGGVVIVKIVSDKVNIEIEIEEPSE